MADLGNPHDRFFKAVFSRTEVAEDFLRHHLPADILALIRPGSLEIGKDSFIDPELKEHYSDLLYSIQMTTGQPGHVYLLFEHKSRPHPLIALDLLRYMTGIWGQAVKSGQGTPLPVILPIVLYHGRRQWRVATDFGSLFDIPPALVSHLPDYCYRLTDLSAFTDDELRGGVLLQAALLVMKYIFQDELPERIPGILGLLKDLPQQQSGLEYLHTVLRYLSRGTNKLSRTELNHAVQQTFARGAAIMSTIADEWIREGEQKGLLRGLQQGITQGISQGISQGELAVLRRQLTRRFGPLPLWAEAMLSQAGQLQLEAWADRVLDAPTLEAVFAEG